MPRGESGVRLASLFQRSMYPVALPILACSCEMLST